MGGRTLDEFVYRCSRRVLTVLNAGVDEQCVYDVKYVLCVHMYSRPLAKLQHGELAVEEMNFDIFISGVAESLGVYSEDTDMYYLVMIYGISELVWLEPAQSWTYGHHASPDEIVCPSRVHEDVGL